MKTTTANLPTAASVSGRWLRSASFNGLLVGLVFLFVAAITIYPWRISILSYDLEWDTRNAEALLHHGVIPQHGGVASFFAFIPPGIAAGVAPGLLLFPREPVLAERVDGLLLTALTVAGLFLLVGRNFGYPTAFWAGAFYLVSTNGLYFAENLRPRAHPVFLIWMVYFLERWVSQRSPRALAIAVFLYLAGTFWMMELIPAALLFVIVWVVYRPPLPGFALVVACLSGLILWSPYLAFESQRHYEDLRCLLIYRRPMTNMDLVFPTLLTDRSLKVVEGRRAHDVLGGPAKTNPAAATNAAPEYEWVTDARVGLCYRARQTTVLEGVTGIWLCPTGGQDWWFFPSDGQRFFNAKTGWTKHGPKGISATGSAGQKWAFLRQGWRRVKLIGAAAFSEVLWRPGLTILSGVAMVGGGWLLIGWGLARNQITSPLFPWMDLGPSERVGWFLLGIAWFAPWLFLLVLVNPLEPDMGRRFLWLWVGLAPFIVVTTRILLRGLSPWLAHLACAALCLLAANNATLVWKTRGWVANHYRPAADSEFNQVIDFVAQEAKLRGETALPIGYDLAWLKWIICARYVDGTSKIGNEYDMVLRFRHGLTNTDTRAEGVSPADEYRIVERVSSDAWRQSYFDLSAFPRMEIALETPLYLVLRKPAGTNVSIIKSLPKSF